MPTLSRSIHEVFVTKILLNLKAEAARTYLGFLWWILEPILYVAVLYLVFTTLIPKDAQSFVAFLLCGTIPFLWFSKSIANSANSIVEGEGLISAMAIPKAFFPLLVVFQDLSKQLVVFLLLFTFLLVYGIEPSQYWFATATVIVCQLLFVTACSLIAALITPFFPDFIYIVPTAILLLMFCSGLFYDYQTMIPEQYWDLFLANPMANLINNYRLTLLDQAPPDWIALLIIGLSSIVAITIALIILRKLDTTYSRLVLQ